MKTQAQLDAMPVSLRVAWLEAMARASLLAAKNVELKDALRAA